MTEGGGTASPDDGPAANTRRSADSIIVGRAREVEVLDSALADAIAGVGGSVFLAGEPGVGKTRLVEEAARLARQWQANVAWGRCWEGEGAPDLWPWQLVVRCCLRAVDEVALRDLVGPHGKELLTLVAPAVISEAAELGTPGARFRSFNAIAHFLDAYSRRAPLVLILEDLHRADPSSLQLLQFFTQEQRQRRILLIATYREPGGGVNRALTQTLLEALREPGTQRLTLANLSAEHCRELARYLIEREIDEEVANAIHRRSGGNPLFLGECVHSILSRGDAGPIDALSVASAPLSVELREMVAQRLSPLVASECAVLRALASIGGAVPPDRISEPDAKSGDATAVAAALAAGEALGLLSRQAGGALRFVHGLVAEVLCMDAAPGPLAAEPEPARLPTASSRGLGIFRREGEYWSVTFAGRTCRMRNSKGLAYIAFLLRHPGRSLHASEIANLGEVAAEAMGTFGREESWAGVRTSLGDSGAFLDAQAKQAYRKHLSEMSAELDEAERFHDRGRAERARREIEFLTDQLTAGVGLGGRDRRAGSDAERARVNVTRSITRALEKMEESHPELARHLTQMIRTGTFCTYAADPGTAAAWDT